MQEEMLHGQVATVILAGSGKVAAESIHKAL